jgi:hypothetical protein
MPLIMSILDDLSNGRPVSMPYLDLWTRAYDEEFVTLARPREMAFHAGLRRSAPSERGSKSLTFLLSLNSSI